MTTTAPDPAPRDPVPRPARSLAPDIARGLMLALIAVANVSWLLWGHDGSVGMSPHVPARTASDSVLQFVMTLAVDHRALPLFALLFGYGMVQFHRSRIGRGIEPRIVRVMMRRRHWAMVLLGLLHAALLFNGDILGAYGIAALLLVWLLFGRRDRTVLIWAGVIAGIMALASVFMMAGGVMASLFTPDDALAEMAASGEEFSIGMVRDLAYGQGYLVTVLMRVVMWVPTTLQSALMMVVPLAIMLGWVAARRRVLDEPWNHVRLLRRAAIGGIAIGWLTGLPDALLNAGLLPLPDAVYWMFVGLNYLGGLACGIGYAAAFGLLAMRLEGRQAEDPSVPGRVPGPLVRALSAVGQRSLTFYLFQSVILVPVFAAWGLGIGPHVSTTGAVAIAFAVWAVSLPLAQLLDARGARGPAEVVLRRLTYGKHDPRPQRSSMSANSSPTVA